MSSAEAKHGWSIKQRFENLVRIYERDINQTTLDSTSSEFQNALVSLIEDCQGVWKELQSAGLFSLVSDTLADLDTFTLRALVVPYMLGDLWQKVQTPKNGAFASSSVAGVIPAAGSTHPSRNEALERSSKCFKEFLTIATDLGLVTEKEVELYDNMVALSRDARIGLFNKQKELKNRMSQLDLEVHRRTLEQRRRDRIRELERTAGDLDDDDGVMLAHKLEHGEANSADQAHHDDEDNDERGDDFSDLKRDKALVQLEWCVGDAFQQMGMSKREADIIGGLSDQAKTRIAKDYQANMELWRERKNDGGRGTYTILPGGFISPGTLGLDGINYREFVKSELFVDRNQPTMSLEEFSQLEMAEVQRQMEAQQWQQSQEEEANSRLNPEELEDKERQRQMAKDDWRDECPVEGITNKGNYS